MDELMERHERGLEDDAKDLARRRDLAAKWQGELKDAAKRLKDWHDEAQAAVEAYRLGKKDAANGKKDGLAMFWANIQTQLALLFGRTPGVAVRQRWADPQDEVARASGVIMERLLDTDVLERVDGYCDALHAALFDFLTAGGGFVRARYEATVVSAEVEQIESSTLPDGRVSTQMVKKSVEMTVDEQVAYEHVHWKRVRWGACRVWQDCPWMAYEVDMSRAAARKRFGDGVAAKLKYYKPNSDEEATDKPGEHTPGARAKVWEIWDKDERQVLWWSEGVDVILDEKSDLYGLPGFFPGPRPLAANLDTSDFLPKPDYSYCCNLYHRVDKIEAALVRCENNIAVKGSYNNACGDLARLFMEPGNVLVPNEQWAAFREGGGFRGNIDIIDIRPFVEAITVLDGRRQAVKQEIYELTGHSDLLRGAGSKGGRATATESQLKAHYGGARMQEKEERFAAFASELATVKAHLIGTKFDAERIIERSNARATFDAQPVAPGQPSLVDQAVAAIKENALAYRVVIKPEGLAMADDAAQQNERQGVMGTLSQFLPAAMQLGGQMPQSVPFILSLLEWLMQGTKGSQSVLSVIHGALDQARQAARQAAAQPHQAPPDPKLAAVQAKNQGEIAKVQAELQADLIRDQSEAELAQRKEVAQREQNVLEAQQTAGVRLATRRPLARREE